MSPGLANDVRVGLGTSGEVFQVAPPFFDDGDVTSDIQNAVAAGTVLADTGQLVAGLTYVKGGYAQTDNGVRFMDLEWRNAANTANVAVFHYMHGALQNSNEMEIRLSIATNERLRWVAVTAVALIVHTWIAANVLPNAVAT